MSESEVTTQPTHKLLTDEELHKIMPKLSEDKRELYLPLLNKAMQTYEINTPLRTAAFLAQLAHESEELKYFEEIWGPTKQQRKYEPPSDVAKRLGNTEVGDGHRYRGRGPIQLTGRFNYKKFGEMLGLDLIGDPDQASLPQIGFATAGLFWKIHELNEMADGRRFVSITRRINGGTNGLAEREKYYATAKRVLGVV